MKLKYIFEKMELDDQVVAVPVGDTAKDYRAVIKLNASAAEIFDLLKQDTSENEVIERLTDRYGEDPNLAEYVHDFISELQAEGVLE